MAKKRFFVSADLFGISRSGWDSGDNNKAGKKMPSKWSNIRGKKGRAEKVNFTPKRGLKRARHLGGAENRGVAKIVIYVGIMSRMENMIIS